MILKKRKICKLFYARYCLKLNKLFHFSVDSFMLHIVQGCSGSALNPLRLMTGCEVDSVVKVLITAGDSHQCV